MSQLQGLEPELRELGYEIIAISPDAPDEVSRVMAREEPGYQALSDAGMDAARAFGIAHTVDPATIEKYKGFGIDLEAASGHDHHQLPVPSVFFVDTEGKIQFTYVNPDYSIRIHPEVIRAAARALKDPEAWNPRKRSNDEE